MGLLDQIGKTGHQDLAWRALAGLRPEPFVISKVACLAAHTSRRVAPRSSRSYFTVESAISRLP